MHCQVDQIIRNVETGWARVPNFIEILLTGREGTRVDSVATRKKDQSIKESNNVRARLMDGEDDRAIVRLGQGDQAFDHIESIISVLKSCQ